MKRVILANRVEPGPLGSKDWREFFQNIQYGGLLKNQDRRNGRTQERRNRVEQPDRPVTSFALKMSLSTKS